MTRVCHQAAWKMGHLAAGNISITLILSAGKMTGMLLSNVNCVHKVVMILRLFPLQKTQSETP